MKGDVKTVLRKLLAPVLNLFEKGTDPYEYKPLNRKILITVGVLFLFLGAVVVTVLVSTNSFDYFLPALVFLLVSFICLIVGTLGSDRAVSKMWGRRGQ